MNISIFGLGYVGLVSAACLSHEGHHVTGVDIVQGKVDLINEGKTPIIEGELDRIVASGVERGTLTATTSVTQAVENSDLSFVCVGTPSHPNGDLDVTYIKRACEHIGKALRQKNSRHVVVIRSTVLPGTVSTTVIPTLEAASGKKAETDFGVCVNPEFIREGSAVHDFYHPPKTVIAGTDQTSLDLLASVYRAMGLTVTVTDIEVAEMIKYADNVWHALKVGFSNEIGNICKSIGIDSHRVMDIFCSDTKLNISQVYLKPGFAFGGSCLPKDVRALSYKGKTLDIDLPIINAILPSNQLQIGRAVSEVMRYGRKKIGFLGFSFKAGTDDLRESPAVEMIERLLGKGYDIRIYDRNVILSALVGANKDYIMERIPHIASLMEPEIERVLEHAEVVVIGNNSGEFSSIMERLRPDQRVVDLVRAVKDTHGSNNYSGLAW